MINYSDVKVIMSNYVVKDFKINFPTTYYSTIRRS